MELLTVSFTQKLDLLWKNWRKPSCDKKVAITQCRSSDSPKYVEAIFGLKMRKHLYDNYYVQTYWWIGTFNQGKNSWHSADVIIALGALQEKLKECCSTSTLDYREPSAWRRIFCECYVRYIILREQGKKIKISKRPWNIVLIAQNAASVSHHQITRQDYLTR